MDDLIIPEDLTTLDDEALAALLAQAIEAFDALNEGEVNAEALATMTVLATEIANLRAESQARVDTAAQVAQEAAALAEQVHGETSPAEAEVDEDGNPIEPPAPTDGGEPAETVIETEPVSVAAGGTPAPRQRVTVPLGAIRDRAPAPALPESNGPITITAAADLPGLTAGQRIGLAEVAQGMHDRARSLQDNGNRSLVATIERPALPDAWHVETESDMEATRAAVDAVLGQFDDASSLVAAGGWCAPNTPIWQFFAVEGTDGLVDLPTVGVDRAGITWPVSPSIADVFSAPWLWTEQNDIDAAGNPHVDPEDDVTKPCFRVPCPTWASARLDAHGICITHGNLSDRAFPENTRRYVSLVESAHEHLISSRLLTAMAAGSAGITIAASAGAASAVLGAVDLQVADYRAKYRMADSAVLETVFPSWTTALFRSDIARRDGLDVFEVSDADVQRWFNARNTRAQFVQDWQTLGAPAAALAWPATLKFMIYAAGTWARGNGGRIDLGVVRDSGLNATNDHTAAWSEEMLLLAKMGSESRVVTVPVCPSGAVGAAATIACPVA